MDDGPGSDISFRVPEELPKTKEELLERLREAKPSLSFFHEDKHIEVMHEDGCRVSLGQIFYRCEDGFIIGEVLYSHARIRDLRDLESEPYEAVIPLVAYAVYDGEGRLVARDLKPYVMVKKLMLNNRPVVVEAKTRLSGTLETLMSLDAACRFRDGCEPPAWSEVYGEVKAAIRRFCNLDWDARLYDVVACWVVATYFHEVFGVLPFLYPYGSTGTGKTRLLKTAVFMARHGFLVTDPSEATLFRTADALKPTLGIDEGLLGAAAWKLIRTAFKRGLYVPRVEKTRREEFILGFFETFMPVAFSSTELPRELGGCDADEARTIFIFMQQMPDPIGRDPEVWDFRALRDKLYLLRLGRANDVIQALRQVEASSLPFHGHEREVWLPLLAVARIMGEEAYASVLGYAAELYGVKAQQQNRNEKIIVRAILKLFRFNYSEALRINRNAYIEHVEFTSTALQGFIKEVLVEWGEYEEHLFPKQWDSRVIGRILTKLGIFRRLKSGRNYYTVTAAKLRQLFKQFYLGGFGGLGGLKKESILSIRNPPENPPTHSLDKFMGGGEPAGGSSGSVGGLNNGKITFEINPPNPPNPPVGVAGGLAGGLSEGKTTFVFNPPNPPNPPTIDGLAVVALRRVTRSLLPTEKCAICGSQGVDYQADLTNGSWRMLCYECGSKLLKMF
ncbi:MAG: hypothetical protein QXT28_06985 [Thermofilaceae archaeon]